MSPASEKHNAQQSGSRQAKWYNSEIDRSRFGAASRELLEQYSHIPSDQVEAHIKTVREKAWDIHPYPCIGRWRFLDLSISTHPAYSRVLSTLQNAEGGSTLLDLGCCFGQDIRKLIYDGVPAERLYGCDLVPEFLDLGYELFNDRQACKAHFFTADIFADKAADEDGGDLHGLDSLLKHEGEFDIVHASSFFHLFNWEEQLHICQRVIRLLKARPGSRVLGRQTGNSQAGESSTEVHKMSGRAPSWRHNEESFKRLWEEAGNLTGTKWTVWAQLVDRGEMEDVSWHEGGVQSMLHEVERLD